MRVERGPQAIGEADPNDSALLVAVSLGGADDFPDLTVAVGAGDFGRHADELAERGHPSPPCNAIS